jgi:hypothetical protein
MEAEDVIGAVTRVQGEILDVPAVAEEEDDMVTPLYSRSIGFLSARKEEIL